jgi:hypothetical protein
MENIIKYFDGEKLQCIIGAVGSLIFLVASAYFLFTQKPLLKGMAYASYPALPISFDHLYRSDHPHAQRHGAGDYLL